MRTVLADTAFYLAYLNPSEQFHELATELAGETGRLILTTEFILVELATFFRKSRDRQKFVLFVSQLSRDSETIIVPATSALFDQGLTLYEQRPDKEWSLTDCMSFETMRSRNISDAYTSDHHFEQAGFRILMK